MEAPQDLCPTAQSDRLILVSLTCGVGEGVFVASILCLGVKKRRDCRLVSAEVGKSSRERQDPEAFFMVSKVYALIKKFY